MAGHPPQKRSNRSPVVLAVGIAVLAVAAGVAVWAQNNSTQRPIASSSAPSYLVTSGSSLAAPSAVLASSASGAPSAATASASLPASSTPAAPANATNLPREMRAMWISYQEWLKNDISTEDKMRDVMQRMFGEAQDMGLNTVIVQVRPFGDALYPSDIYPWSHHLTGTQGKNPGYDPLAVMVEEAHAHFLRFEAWVTPYRVNLPGKGIGPTKLAASNPAVLHPEWVREVKGVGTFYDPGLPEVQQMVVDGIAEIVQKYAVDGIHLDNDFYPIFTAQQAKNGTDTAFDEDSYAQYANGTDPAAWRQQNINNLLQAAHAAIKTQNPAVSFGLSAGGNNNQNHTQQYSNIALWMAEADYCDYIMPQLFYGFGYRAPDGSDSLSFRNLAAQWASLPRAPTVRLYAGLGAYLIEGGDGSADTKEEWNSGHNLAAMVTELRSIDGFSGFSLFRYEVLYGNRASPLAKDEVAALTKALAA